MNILCVKLLIHNIELSLIILFIILFFLQKINIVNHLLKQYK